MRTVLGKLCTFALTILAGVTSARAETGFALMDDGAKLFYEREGSGPPVVVPLHIFTYKWLRALSSEWTIVSYDVRNRGRSSRVEDVAKLTIQQDVADLEALRRHFGFEKIDLIGHSYTGLMVYLYAAAHPGRVGRIVQLGPVPPVFGTEYLSSYVYSDDAGDANSVRVLNMREAGLRESEPERYCLAVYAVWMQQLVGNPTQVSVLDGLDRDVCSQPNEWLTNFNRHIERHFASIQNLALDRGTIRQFELPVLTIHGTKDRNSPYGAGREWAFLLPNARLLTVEGAAHAVFAERPEIVIPAIRAFLQGGWPAESKHISESPLKSN